MSVEAIFQQCLASLILNCEEIIEFLKSNSQKFHNVWLRKKKNLLRLLMLVVVKAIFDKKKAIVKVCTTEVRDDYLRFKV